MGTPVDLHAVLHERGQEYGDFVSMSEFAQDLKERIRSAPGAHRLEPYQWESLDMICTKIARVVCGNPQHEDSWTDIAGYAKLVADHLRKEHPEDASHVAYREMVKRHDAFST